MVSCRDVCWLVLDARVDFHDQPEVFFISKHLFSHYLQRCWVRFWRQSVSGIMWIYYWHIGEVKGSPSSLSALPPFTSLNLKEVFPVSHLRVSIHPQDTSAQTPESLQSQALFVHVCLSASLQQIIAWIMKICKWLKFSMVMNSNPWGNTPSQTVGKKAFQGSVNVYLTALSSRLKHRCRLKWSSWHCYHPSKYNQQQLYVFLFVSLLVLKEIIG